MRALHRFHRRRPQADRVPSYLLPPVSREVVFDPSLRRAGDILRGT